MATLTEVPRLAIGTWPTPVTRMAAVSGLLGVDVWLKHEEAAGAWGGNKVRKLEFILAAARSKARHKLVTYGAGSSSWAAAAALHGRAHAFAVHLGLGGPIPEHYRRLYDRLGARVTHAAALQMVPVAALRAALGAGARGTAVLPAGGSSGPGDFGSLEAGREIASSVAAGQLRRPERVYVAAGTGGTTAGLAVGMGVEDLAVPVFAVRVAPWPYGTPGLMRRRTRSLLRRVAEHEPRLRNAVAAPVVTEEGFFGPGYGRPTPESLEAIEVAARDGVTLDGTYAAKAFAALIAAARSGARGPLLFVHTSPGPLPDPIPPS